MKLKFTKMHGLGNDFVIIDGVRQKFNLNSHQISNLADRHMGIGFDQLLLIESSSDPKIDFNYRIFNANGNEVGQCGNGARCLALFAKYHQLTEKDRLLIKTKTNVMELHILGDQQVSINMGIPKILPEEIPYLTNLPQKKYSLAFKNQIIYFHLLNIGNPHAVVMVHNVHQAAVEEIGYFLSTHPNFPEQTNVGFVNIINPKSLELRVYERGCGETLACGSGAVAAAAIGRLYYTMDDEIEVSVTKGTLVIKWPDITQSIHLIGPASFVYDGTLL